MTQQHPIAPPPELLQQWINEEDGLTAGHIATRAAQWGADTELEACIDWISVYTGLEHPELLIELLRAARRPKPPGLKEQALALVEQHEDGWRPSPKDWDTIRRALEALPE
jgi:hypothetical protein